MRTVFLLSLFLSVSALPLDAFAQEQKVPGMRHLTISPSPAAPAADAGNDEKAAEKKEQPAEKTNIEEADASPSPAPTPEPPALSVEKTLVKPGDLKHWDHISLLAAAATPEGVAKALSMVEADRGAVPPQGLLLLAKALADQNRMEEASLYFFLGQLRASFDIARWPPRASKEEAEKLIAESKKTEDQTEKQPKPHTIKIKNPHEVLTALSKSVSADVNAWAMKDPKRLDSVLEQVRVWDLSAPYAYHPGYDLPEPIPFKQWSKILPAVRESFFLQMNQISSSLKQVKQ
jgi:hypothetical protein